MTSLSFLLCGGAAAPITRMIGLGWFCRASLRVLDLSELPHKLLKRARNPGLTSTLERVTGLDRDNFTYLYLAKLTLNLVFECTKYT
jgi:hypothetical protein